MHGKTVEGKIIIFIYKIISIYVFFRNYITESHKKEINSPAGYYLSNLPPSERRENSEGDNLYPKRTGSCMLGTVSSILKLYVSLCIVI